MTRLELPPIYYDADKAGESGGATAEFQDGLNGEGAMLKQRHVAMQAGEALVIDPPTEPQMPSVEVTALEERIKQLEDNFAVLLRSFESLNTQLMTLTETIGTSNSDVKKELEKMQQTIQDYFKNSPQPPVQETNGIGGKRTSKPRANGKSKSEPEPKPADNDQKNPGPLRGPNGKFISQTNGQSSPDASLNGSASSSVSEAVAEDPEDHPIPDPIQVILFDDPPVEDEPQVSPAATVSTAAVIAEIVDPEEGDSPLITVVDEETGASQVIDITPTVVSTDPVPPVGAVPAAQQSPATSKNFIQQLGRGAKNLFENLKPKSKPKAPEVDPNSPLVDPNEPVVPVIDVAALSQEELDRHHANATNKLNALYIEVFRGGHDKKDIEGEKFVGGIVPVALGLTSAAMAVPVAGAFVAGGLAYAASEIRRQRSDETAFDQFTRFSFIGGRPESKHNWIIKPLQLVGRGFERMHLKNRLGLKDFKGSKEVRNLIGYLKEDKSIEIPQDILNDEKKVDNLLFEANWYLDSTRALFELGAYLTKKEQQNWGKTREKVYDAWKALLDKKYGDVVSRSYFADRLYADQKKREEWVFAWQAVGLGGIEAAKTLIAFSYLPMWGLAYAGSLANRNEFQVYLNQVGDGFQSVGTSLSGIGRATGEFVSGIGSTVQNDLASAQEWFINNVGTIRLDAATEQIEILQNSITVEGGAGGSGSGLNGVVEWLRSQNANGNTNRILTPEECRQIHQSLQQ